MSEASFRELALADAPLVVAPDRSDVRVLLALRGGSMAHFSLAPGVTSVAVRHRTVDEIWFVLAGEGEIWRRDDGGERVVALQPGLCLTIPVGTAFQFRSFGSGPLQVVAVTMPPWPGAEEAELVRGHAAWDG